MSMICSMYRGWLMVLAVKLEDGLLGMVVGLYRARTKVKVIVRSDEYDYQWRYFRRDGGLLTIAFVGLYRFLVS